MPRGTASLGRTNHGLMLWHGRALVVGPGIDSTPHAHYAAQISFALERPVLVRRNLDAPWQETRAAVFAPNEAHQLDCDGALMAHLFVELPVRQRTIDTTLDAAFQHAPEFVAVQAALERVLNGQLDIDVAEQALHQWLACAIPVSLTPYAYDPRIGAALTWIASNTGMRPSGALLAEMAHLSESRFTHLFRQQTGLPLSRYLLWARLLEAVAAVARGDSMTAAAHHAGFSDLAHMSRTFRATFGVIPSELHKMTIAFKQK